MIHRHTAIIAKAFRAKEKQFHIEQRGSFSSVSLSLESQSADVKLLRFISTEAKTTAYILDVWQPEHEVETAGLYLAANELNELFPMRFFVVGSIIVAKYDVPSFLSADLLGEFCCGLCAEIKEAYRAIPEIVAKWLSQEV